MTQAVSKVKEWDFLSQGMPADLLVYDYENIQILEQEKLWGTVTSTRCPLQKGL